MPRLAIDLREARRLGSRAGELLSDNLDQLAHGIVAGGGVDAEHARVRQRPHTRVDGVTEPALLTHLLEEPRGHAAAEEAGENLARIELARTVGRACEAHHQVALLEGLGRGARAADVDGRIEFRPAAPGQLGEHALSLAHDRVVAEIAGGGQHHAIGAVVGVQEATKVFRGEARHAFGRPEDGPANGLGRERRLLQKLVDELIRAVARSRDLLQDHFALALQLVFRVERRLQDVGKNIEREANILFQHAGIVGRGFEAGRRIEFAADRLDLFRDGNGRAPCGALERHVLEEMRDAVLVRRFVACPGTNPDPERNRLDVRHVMRHDPQAVGKRRDVGEAARHARPPKPLRCATKSFTALRSFGSTSKRSRSVSRLESRGGRPGRSPVIASSASGTFAG